MTKKPVANYIVYQMRGQGKPRIYVPKDWLEAEEIGQYDVIKVSFEVVERYKGKKNSDNEEKD